MQLASPLRELTCNMGSHSVAGHGAEMTFLPLPQPIDNLFLPRSMVGNNKLEYLAVYGRASMGS